jgi:hypothetical protein
MSKSKNPRLKKAFQKTEYTPEMIQELKKCASDPIYFIKNYVYIKGTKGRMLFDLHPYQERMILNYLHHDRSISLVSRQGGKSETASAFITWYYCFHKEKSILITSYRGENSKEIIQKIQYAYEELPDWIKPGVDENNWNKLSVAFENKCRILADTTSENTGRGFAIDLLYVDELAFVKDTIADSFYGSVLPTLSSRVDGNMIITSTPNGDTNLFAKLWKEAIGGVNGFAPLAVAWNEIPGRDEAYKKKMIAQFGERRFRQEFGCEFLTSENTLIDLEDVNRLLESIKDKEIIFSIKNQNFWKPLNKKLSYIVGIDPATGNGKDFTVIHIYEFPSMELVSEYRTNNYGAPEVYAHLKNIFKYMDFYGGDIYFSIENNGVGQGIIALYQNDDNFTSNAVFVSEKGKDQLGFFTTDKTKFKSCLLLKEMLLKGNMKINSPTMLTELKSFVRSKGSYDHQDGATADCISATLICIRVMEEMSSYDDNAFHKLYTAGLEKVEKEISENKDWDFDESYVPDPFIFI